ncbi:integrase [Herbaspirillum sp. HC18]|nr:integrase [Herbaspirillum sp. HC18]
MPFDLPTTPSLAQACTMTYSLFATPDVIHLETTLKQSFEDWLTWRGRSASKARAHRPLREDSAEVYRDMWHAFAPYCAERGLNLHALAEEDLQIFLTTRGTSAAGPHMRATGKQADLTPRYARRFLSLIDWVTSHQAKEEGVTANPAARTLLQRAEYKYANAAEKDPAPEYLSDVQSKRLIAYVTQLPGRHAASEPLTWKAVRDRTAVAMMLGAGLTPGDVRAVQLPGVLVVGGRKAGVPWALALPGNGNFPARETPLASWAGRQLAYWLAVRTEQNIGGTFVFPSTRDGKQWSDTRCFLSCREVLAAAGIASDAGGLFKLRHTFALRQLSHGKSEADVAKWLGLLDSNGMLRYRRILTSPIDVV